jgi:hypothetical protein
MPAFGYGPPPVSPLDFVDPGLLAILGDSLLDEEELRELAGLPKHMPDVGQHHPDWKDYVQTHQCGPTYNALINLFVGHMGSSPLYHENKCWSFVECLVVFYRWAHAEKNAKGETRWRGTTLRGWYSAHKKFFSLVHGINLDTRCPILNTKLDLWEKEQPPLTKAATFEEAEWWRILHLTNNPDILPFKG